MKSAKPSAILPLAIRAGGRFKIRVLRSDKSIRLETDWQKNLILNPGIRGADGETWLNQLASCRAGTGTTPSKATLDGTFAISGTTLTRSTGTGTFSAGDVDKYVKFGTGEEHLIVSYTSATEVEVRDTATVAASTLEVYDTARIALDAEVADHASLSGEVGANGFTTNVATGNITYKRTYDYAVEGGTVNYNEIGISDAVGDDLWSRIVLGSTVTVNIGEQLQVVYELSLTSSTWLTATPLTPVVSGWPWVYTNTGFTSDSSEFIVTTDENHHYSAGDVITISGATPSGYNGTWTIDSVTATTITVLDVSNLGVDSAPGTLTGTLAGSVRLQSGTGYVTFAQQTSHYDLCEPDSTTNFSFNAVQEGNVIVPGGLGSGNVSATSTIATRGYSKTAMDSNDFSWEQSDEWDIDEANWTDFRQFYFQGGPGSNHAAIIFTFDQNQRKDSGYSLRMGWKVTFRQDLP
jgi:hypothetical protein